jgi:hypothetical protein
MDSPNKSAEFRGQNGGYIYTQSSAPFKTVKIHKKKVFL